MYNNVPYDREFTRLNFVHLAIVNNPRYEGANIVFNSKTDVDTVDNILIQNYNPEQKRDEYGQWAKDEAINPNYKEDLKQVIYKAKNNPKERQKLVIGKVSKDLAEKAKENGYDIAGYNHDIDVSGTRHAIKEHGQAKTENPRGQIAITDSDFEKIPDVIYSYDDVSFTGKNKIGRDTITYQKAFNDGTIIYIEEIRNKRNTLTINTMYKYKNTDNPRTFVDNNNPLSNASIFIITDIQEDFNPNITNSKENEDSMDFVEQFKDCLYQAIDEVINNSVDNGFVTLKGKVDDEGNPIVIYIPNYIPQGGVASGFHKDMANHNDTGKTVYNWDRTRAKISESQKDYIKGKVDNVLSAYKIEPPLKGLNVCNIGNGCLGVGIMSEKTRTLSLDSSIFKENGIKAFENSVEKGWLAKTGKDAVTSVLTHELGHTITAGIKDEKFWDKIKDIKKEYNKNVKENDIKNPDFISKYARKTDDEFVAESFAQATLLKNPSKYAKMVLDEIGKNFALNKQQRLFNSIMRILNAMDKEKDEKQEEQIMWIEGGGVGYCLTEEDYEKRKKEIEEHEKQERNS